MAKNRNYSCKDVDMLVASKTIAGSFRTFIGELSATRTAWTEQYAQDLIARIDSAMGHYLGTDAKKDLRGATAALAGIQGPARRDVSYFKVQVADDFKKDPARRDEILITLGFASYLRAVQLGNQEALIQLLFAFKNNLTAGIRQEITAKGLNATLIDNIMGYAEAFSQANVAQENLKGSSKTVTMEVSDAFNAIYDEIIGICKIASAYYRFEQLKKEQFTFNKILANLGGTRKAAKEEPAVAAQ
jgi:hypothetical protein